MKFVEKCPKCTGQVQTKSLKKSIGLGFVKIPVSQFCLNPSCDWYQDFSEAAGAGEIGQDVLQVKIPLIGYHVPEIKRRFSELKENTPEIVKQNILVVKGVIAVIAFSIIVIFLLSFLRP